MRIGILRLNCGEFGKIGSYNVQEIGLAKALCEYTGELPYVFYLNKDVEKPETDPENGRVVYLPHRGIGVHGIFDTGLLDAYDLQGMIVFSDNQFWQNHVIHYCEKRSIPCVCYWGGVLSQKASIVKQLFTVGILIKNWRSYHKCINIAKTNDVYAKMRKFRIPVASVVHIGLDETLLQDVEHYDKEEARRDLGLGSGRILLYVGRMVANKRPIEALRLFEKMADEDPALQLVLIGEGPLAQTLREMIQNSRFKDRVRYEGAVAYRQMYRYYVAADVLINLCSVEIFGMAILEAMHYGCIPVAMQAPGPCEYIVHAQNGYISQTSDDGQWRENIRAALQSGADIRRNAHETIVRNYLWRNSAVAFFEKLNEKGKNA